MSFFLFYLLETFGFQSQLALHNRCDRQQMRANYSDYNERHLEVDPGFFSLLWHPPVVLAKCISCPDKQHFIKSTKSIKSSRIEPELGIVELSYSSSANPRGFLHTPTIRKDIYVSVSAAAPASASEEKVDADAQGEGEGDTDSAAVPKQVPKLAGYSNLRIDDESDKSRRKKEYLKPSWRPPLKAGRRSSVQ
jgi:hypothetical protein